MLSNQILHGEKGMVGLGVNGMQKYCFRFVVGWMQFLPPQMPTLTPAPLRGPCRTCISSSSFPLPRLSRVVVLPLPASTHRKPSWAQGWAAKHPVTLLATQSQEHALKCESLPHPKLIPVTGMRRPAFSWSLLSAVFLTSFWVVLITGGNGKKD